MTGSTWTVGGWAAIAGLLYGVVLWFLAMGAGGGGHGSAIPMLLTLGPFLLLFAVFEFAAVYGPSLIWAGYGYLIGMSHRSDRFRAWAIGVLLLHTFFGLVCGLGYAWFDREHLTRMSGEVAIMWAPLYLVGQGVAWSRLLTK
jgi:hypothetical protein